MFIKLLKHDMAYNLPKYLELLLVMAGTLLMSIIVKMFKIEFLDSPTLILVILLVVAVLVCVFLFTLMQAGQELIGKKSYLTHSIPASTTQILLSKSLSSGLWYLFMCVASFLFLGAYYLFGMNDTLKSGFALLYQQLNSSGLIPAFLLYGIASIIQFSVIIIFAVSVAGFHKFSEKNRGVLAAVLIGYFTNQIIAAIAMFVSFKLGRESVTWTLTEATVTGADIIIKFCICYSIIITVIAVGLFFIASRLMKKRSI